MNYNKVLKNRMAPRGASEDGTNYGFSPGELIPVEPLVPSRYSEIPDRCAIFLSKDTAEILRDAKIPIFSLDLLIRQLAIDWTHARIPH